MLRNEKILLKINVAASVAAVTDEKASYIKNKAFDKDYYRKLVIEFLTKYKQATRTEIDDLLMEKLSKCTFDRPKKDKDSESIIRYVKKRRRN